MAGSDVFPDDYISVLAEAKQTIEAARVQAALTVNAGLIELYWNLGQLMVSRQDSEGWGTKVIKRLSNDLRASFPQVTGLSERNLRYMRDFALCWPDKSIWPQLAAKLPWGHNRLLLDKFRDDQQRREWYAGQAVEFGWSRGVLAFQIDSQLHLRAGSAPSNFVEKLPSGDSELMQELTKDPYHLEFLGLSSDASEREIEQGLIDHIDRFLRELGQGFTLAGRQYRLDVEGDEFFVDLLMFHTVTNRYIVIELKKNKLTPADVGQLNFYVAVVDDTLRQPHHKETIGLLLCGDKNEQTVRYSLGRATSPMAVSGMTFGELPETARQALPEEKQLIEVVAHALEKK